MKLNQTRLQEDIISLKTFGLAVVAGFCFVGNTFAADWRWTGTAADGMWSTGGNWDNGGTVPGATADGVFLTGGAFSATIAAGETQSPGSGTSFGSVFPEFGADLNIYGTLNLKWYLHPVATAADRTVINMYGNSVLTGEGIGLGYNWFFNGAPYVTMNLNDNSAVNVNFFFWGGQLNLNGGTFTTGGFADGNSDQVSDATRLMNISGGKLVLPGDATATVNSWLARGILQAYGGDGQIVIDTVTTPGKTLVIGTVPEPSVFGLMLLGGLACIRRRRK